MVEKKFRMIGDRDSGGLSISLDRRQTTTLRYGSADFDIILDDGERKRGRCQRAFIEGPDGVNVLPYFYRGESVWVVMVRQFRIALGGQNKETLECPGGGLEGEVLAGMVKELYEETRICVDLNRIKLVLHELAWPSMLSVAAWGGIVKIDESEIPKELLFGEWFDGEYSIREIHPLKNLLEFRDSDEMRFDLWTSRMLDELAKEVGLFSRTY